MSRRPRNGPADFFIQRDRNSLSLSRKVPYFLLGITVLLSMNILLLLQQQPNHEGIPLVNTELLDTRRLRQYREPNAHHRPRDDAFQQKLSASEDNLIGDAAALDAPNKFSAGFQSTPNQHRAADSNPKKYVQVQDQSNSEPVKPAPILEVTTPSIVNSEKLVIYGKLPKSTLPPLQTGSYITPNEILQRTAIAIKTFNRAECLSMTVASFKLNYPDLPIFVADDSFEDTVSKNLTETYDVTYIRLPVDSGVGYGRNRLVQQIHELGYQYMVMSDDDYTIEQHDLLLMMAEHLIGTKADAVAPLRCDYGHCERSKGMIHMNRNGELTVFPNMTAYPNEEVSTCHRSDLMQQFFLTETRTLKRVHWDDRLKNNDHYDFLFNAKRNNLTLVTCTDINVQHNKKICQDKVEPELMENYLQVRAERWLNLTSVVFNKWKISRLFDETGKTILLDPQSSRPVITPVQRVVVNATHPLRQYFEQAVLDHHNNNNPGWYSLKIKPNSRKTYIVYKQLNRCMYWMGGKLDVFYDRHDSFPNKNQVITFEFHHINSSCPLAEDFWQLRQHGKLGNRHVYLVTAVSNDPKHMDRLLDLINNQTNREHITFVIVDMGKDTEKYDLENKKLLVDTQYIYLGGPFSRSIGLKKGFDYAKQLAQTRGQKEAIGFSIDTSIIIPSNFSDIIRSNVRCGLSSFAPVCYKHKDPGGYWVTTGYGMIGACFDDYDAIGGWDTRWGYRWGAEDVDIMNRMLKHLPFTVRTKEDHFEHLHSGSTRTNYKLYYKNKNLYDGDLPVTPLTTKLNDTQLSQRLFSWVKPFIKYPAELKNDQIYSTYNMQDGKWVYDVRFRSENGDKYYAVVDSLL